MVAKSLFGARLKEEDIDLVSHTISTVQEPIVRQSLQPYLNPWFAVSGELRKHEEMRVAQMAFCWRLVFVATTSRPQPAADPDGCRLQRWRRNQ